MTKGEAKKMGATHYYSNVFGVKYYKFISTYLMLWHEDRWISSMMDVDKIKSL